MKGLFFMNKYRVSQLFTVICLRIIENKKIEQCLLPLFIYGVRFSTDKGEITIYSALVSGITFYVDLLLGESYRCLFGKLNQKWYPYKENDCGEQYV